jgi:Mg2+-importing ATPase
MLPVQVLTNNLLYDFSQTGIPSDNVDEELITRPLKWDIGNIKRFMISIGPISSIFDYATFALMWFFFHCSAFTDPATGHIKRRRSQAFSKPAGSGIASDSNADRPHHKNTADTLLRSRASLHLTLTTLVIMSIGAWLPYFTFAGKLGMVPLPPVYWSGLRSSSFHMRYSRIP